MSTTQLRLVWTEHEFDQIVTSFDFRIDFNLDDEDIYCGKFDPAGAINFEGQPLEVIYFKDFTYEEKQFSFNFPNGKSSRFTISNTKTEIPVKFTIIPPEPIPVPDSWNAFIKTSDGSCFTHLFYYPQEGDRTLQFMKTLRCSWSNMATNIIEALAERNLGHYGKSVGILTNAGSIPDLESLDVYFNTPDSYRKGRALMIMVVSSFEELTLVFGNFIISTKNVPRIPKDIIHRCRLTAAVQGYQKHIRRVLKIAINGGIPVDLLHQASIKKNNNDMFNSSDFERIFLRFGTAPDLPASLKRRLIEIFEDSIDHLRVSSSELALRTIFWDSLIKEMLRRGHEGHIVKPFIFEPEWNSTNLFPNFNLRKTDIAILFRLPGRMEEYPIAIIEEAKEDFDFENPHKDFTKLSAMLSSTCIKMAYDMARIRKRPEEARGYGALIGRGKIQFIIAHPVISKIQVENETLHEIHCNISSSSHCIYDVSKPPSHAPSPAASIAEDDLCCHVARFKEKKYEILVPGEIDVNNFEFLPEALKTSVEDIVLPVSETRPERPPPVNEINNERLFKNGFNDITLRNIYFFIECFKERINLIKSTASDMEGTDRREFFEPGKFGEFGSGKPSASRESPQKIASTKAMSETQLEKTAKNLRSRLFRIEKTSLYELKITIHLSNIFPQSFPILYDYKIEGEKFGYFFERLEPLMSRYRSISRLIAGPTAEESLFHCFCLSTQCLFGLENLHFYMQLVHSDISPWNIMYSETTKTWKLIDFDQSRFTSESLTDSRVAGTKGYIAPESEETGIFTEKSDIYSLGKVFLEVIDSILLNQIHSVESDDEDDETIARIRSIEPIAMKFSNCINSMIQSDPSARPSAIAALRTVYGLFESTFDIPDQLIFHSIESRLKIDQSDKERRSKQEVEEISEKDIVNPILPIIVPLSPSKRTRIAEEEKEPSTRITPQVQ